MAYQGSMHTLQRLAVLAPLLAGGCVTFYDPQAEQQEALRQRQQATALQDRFDRMNTRIESLQEEVGRLRADMERQRTDQGRAGSAEVQGVRESVDDLNRRLAAESAARERDRKVILDSVASMLKSSATPPRSTVSTSGGRRTSTGTSAGSGSGRGLLHKVEAGETVSAIATAYKVSSAAVLEANGLKNPNQLRVGQELVIPSP